VEQWAAADLANRRELEAMLAIWSESEGADPEIDVDAAWQQVKERIGESEGHGKVIPLWRGPMVRWAAAAAVIVGLFALGHLFVSPQEAFVAFADRLTSTLSDSTHVVLSPNSRMAVRMGDERRIALHGQAWFEVARDVTHPFIVQAEDLQVTVLGTGFEVSAYDSANVWSVRVRHGRVRVQAQDQQVELGAGERVRYDRGTGSLTREGPVSVETWGDRIVRFENAPMSEVAGELQRMFHVRVDLSNEALGRCRLTATFENERIEDVLHVISGTFGLRLSQPASDHFVLEGDGC
jgi:transmembrane sensor